MVNLIVKRLFDGQLIFIKLNMNYPIHKKEADELSFPLVRRSLTPVACLYNCGIATTTHYKPTFSV